MTRERRIKQELKQLRAVCIDDQSDVVLKQIAYEIETAVRYATERTVGWPGFIEMAKSGADRLRKELKVPTGDRTAP